MFLVSWPGGSWEASLKMGLVVFGIYLAIMWAALVFWVYRDIRQRSRDPIVQTAAVLAALIFFLPGHWVYLILRPSYTLTELYERSLEEETLLQELEDQKACPTCKRRVHDEYLICPSCRTQLKDPCRTCNKPLSHAWLICPFCATEKAGARQPQPAQAAPPPPPVAQRPPPMPARPNSVPNTQSVVTRPRPPASQPARPVQPVDDGGQVIDATAD